jgi:hypothetical protein
MLAVVRYVRAGSATFDMSPQGLFLMESTTSVMSGGRIEDDSGSCRVEALSVVLL